MESTLTPYFWLKKKKQGTPVLCQVHCNLYFAELAQVQEDVTSLQETKEDLKGEKPGLSSLPGVSLVSSGSLKTSFLLFPFPT